jgi:hypothetical protein
LIVHLWVEVREMHLHACHVFAEEDPGEISAIASQPAKIDGVVASRTGNRGNMKLYVIELLN